MSVLHVLNGDATREILELADVAGDLAVFADVLHEGHVPPGFDAAALATRARWLAGADYGPFDVMMDFGTRWQAALDRHAEYDDVVLWFEHDLFDQLLLVRQLAFFDGVQRTDGLLLISSDDYLGRMRPEQLTRLYDTRVRVSAGQRALGVRTWRAFTGEDAGALQSVAESDTSVLPFLHDALLRMLQEYPSTTNGLGRIDDQILALLMTGERSPGQLFGEHTRLEESIFLGDLTFWLHLQQLAHARVPLLELDVEGDMNGELPDGVTRITDAGRDVVTGKADAIALNGIDRWIGGVHLQGHARWRWDSERGALTPS